MRDHQDAERAEAEKASAKIEEAFGKLTRKMRERADKAKGEMDDTRNPEKRAVPLRRFESSWDAATHLEERLPAATTEAKAASSPAGPRSDRAAGQRSALRGPDIYRARGEQRQRP